MMGFTVIMIPIHAPAALAMAVITIKSLRMKKKYVRRADYRPNTKLVLTKEILKIKNTTAISSMSISQHLLAQKDTLAFNV